MNVNLLEPWQAVHNHLDNIVAYLKTVLPKQVTIEVYGGRFGKDDLAIYSKKAPALLVSLVRLQTSSANQQITSNIRTSPIPVRGDTQVVMDLTISITLIAKDVTRTLDRNQVAVNLVQCLAMVLPQQTFNTENVTPVRARIDCRNLFNAQVDKHYKAAFWGTAFDQQLTVPLPENISDVPENLFLGESPNTGPDNLDQYEQIKGE